MIPEQPEEFSPDRITKLSWKGSGKLVHGAGSNFFIEPDGTHVEGEFQAAKHRNPFARQVYARRFCRMHPGVSKKAGRAILIREDWEYVKQSVMTELVLRKFRDHDDLAEWLIATGDKKIIEGNHWHDNYWGSCYCAACANIDGRNELGKILMHVRDTIKQERK